MVSRIRSWVARLVLRLARLIDPEAQDDLDRIQRYNENLNTELTRERGKRAAQAGEIRWFKSRIQELEEALEAQSGKEAIH